MGEFSRTFIWPSTSRASGGIPMCINDWALCQSTPSGRSRVPSLVGVARCSVSLSQMSPVEFPPWATATNEGVGDLRKARRPCPAVIRPASVDLCSVFVVPCSKANKQTIVLRRSDRRPTPTSRKMSQCHVWT